MVALAQEGLLDDLVQTLDILFINDLGEDPEGVCLDHVVFGLLDVLVEAGDDDEDFVFTDFELLDEDVDEAAESLVVTGAHLEELCHIKEHGTLLKIRKVLSLFT